MVKFSILFDPDKYYLTARMFEETVKNKEILEKVCDFWVGGTRASSKDISFWLKKLKEYGFEERFLFPAKPSHAFSGKYAKYILRPELLNRTPSLNNPIVHLFTKIGKAATMVLYPSEPPFKLDFGYLILGPESSVGKFTGAAKICDEYALERIKKYVKANEKCHGIYIESGSGAKVSITQRSNLLKKAREVVPSNKVVYGGGGIKSIGEVLFLMELGIHPVIGTHFEKNPKDIYNFAREVYKRA